MQTPLVSIIIPTYNRAHLIGETLDSVLAQTYSNWECIVVDDGSTDNTATLLAEYSAKDSRFQYHHRPSDRPKGANACRNYGFELSKGEYVNWFDDDDLMLEDFLKNKITVLTKELDLVICSGYEVDQYLKDKIAIKLDENAELFKEYVLWKLQVLTPSVLFKKSFLRDKDLFSNKIRRGQETELFSRLFFLLPQQKFKIINTPLFLYRQHQKSKTEKSKKYIKKFKESQSIIITENFKRSLQLKDEELVYFLYKSLIKLLFLSLKKEHLKNSELIKNNLIAILKKDNKKLMIEFSFFIRIFSIFKISSYRVEKRIENFTINY